MYFKVVSDSNDEKEVKKPEVETDDVELDLQWDNQTTDKKDVSSLDILIS